MPLASPTSLSLLGCLWSQINSKEVTIVHSKNDTMCRFHITINKSLSSTPCQFRAQQNSICSVLYNTVIILTTATILFVDFCNV